MTQNPATALLMANPLPATGVADWVHLLPAGSITSIDGRGPYWVENAEAVIAASFEGASKLPVDENHAIHSAASRGDPSPARGYIVAMEAREDGIWGRVDWTEAGKALMADRAYLGMSPAIRYDQRSMRVLKITDAALTNRPSLRGLTALHQEQETPMNELLEKLKAMLGLEPDAEESDMWSALDAVITTAKAEKAKNASADALHAQIAEIGVALGVPDASAEALVETARALHAAQAEAQTLSERLATVETQQRRERAEAWMAGQVAAKRMIPADAREGLIALHMREPERAETIAGLYPEGGAARFAQGKPPADTGAQALHSTADDLVGKARALQAAEAAKGNTISWIDAVHRVSEAK